MIVIGPEPEGTLKKYVAEGGLEVDRVSSSATIGHEFKAAATPTLVLVDSQGRAVRSWRGELREREKEVEDALKAVTNP